MGGTGGYDCVLAAEADRERFDVEVWSLDLRGEMVDVLGRRNVPVRVLGKGTGFRFGFVRKLRREIAAGPVPIAARPPHAGCSMGAFGDPRVPRRPVLVRTEHTYVHRKRWSAMAGHLFTGAWYAAVIGVSESTTAAHRRIDPFWAKRYRAIPNGISMRASLPSREDSRRILQGLGIPSADRLVVSVGNLREPKGQDVLLEATARVIPNLDVRLVAFGEDH
jgi:glycosyltransferase involved in cell wall biosynthesis